ncbi:MAG: hypothetical protein ISS66_05530 [Desulfobacteraceae bacterium]|nr:hypothetical protein [Desulfobacteraceae bacterium]
MKNDKKEAEKLKELLKKADGHPMMKAILAEEAAAILAKRMEADGKIEVLKKERDEIIPRLQADLAGKEAKYKTVKTALDVAVDEFKKAKVTLSSKGLSLDRAISRQADILIETADPALDEAIVFFNGKLDFLRSPGRIDHIACGSERNIFTDTKTVKEENNVDAVRSALAYCHAAVKELEKMKLTPSLDVEKIEKMKTGVPSIDVYTAVTGEKPLPGSKGVNPLHLLPSDSEMDYRRDTVMEKVKKVMKR